MFLAMADRNRNSLLTIATISLICTFVGKGAYGQCLINLVVNEGALDTIMGCAAGPNDTAWTTRPISNASTTFKIITYDDIVNATLAGLYAYNSSGLIIRNATTTATDGPIPTAGIYIVRFSNDTLVAAKLVVIRSGPVCSCIPLASGGVNISCNIIYADHPVGQINPIVKCSANGQLYTSGPPIKTLNFTQTTYVYNSTSTITINSTVPTAYDCQLTFAAPSPATPPYLATNAPTFSANFTVCENPTTTASPTTVQPTTTTTKSPTTTTKLPTTTTKLPTTTTKLPTTTTMLPTTTTRLPTTTTKLPTTTTNPPTTATMLPTTTTKLPTTTSQPPATTTQPPTSISDRPTTTAEPTTTNQPTTTTTAITIVPSTTTMQPTVTTQKPTGAIDIGLLTTKIILSTILGLLLMTIAAICCSWCFLSICPPVLPFRRSTRYFDSAIRMFQRQRWIPVRRGIRQAEYWDIPFYRQSFSKYPIPCKYRLPSGYSTPYEYRPPSRCRCVQSCVTQPLPQECRCGQQARSKGYYRL